MVCDETVKLDVAKWSNWIPEGEAEQSINVRKGLQTRAVATEYACKTKS